MNESQSSASSPTVPEKWSVGGAVGVALLLAIVFGVPALVIWTYWPIYTQRTHPIPGQSHAFNPIWAFDEVQRFAGPDARFVGMNARSVRSDGTMELHAAYAPNVRYEFVRPASAPADAPPTGEQVAWSEEITLTVSKPWKTGVVGHLSGSGVFTKIQFLDLGMRRDVDSPKAEPAPIAVPMPTCQFGDLWKVAMAHGASSEAVADISYDSSGYDFRIEHTQIKLHFDPRCESSS